MACHPRLVVRFGRARSITSPTGSTGYGFQGILAAFIACGFVAVAATQEPLVLLALALPGVFLRDAWAWFAATEEERASFRGEVECLKARGWSPPPDQVVIGARWGWRAVAGLLACLALSIALVAFVHPAFLVVTLFMAVVLAAALFVRLRARTHQSVA